MLVTRCRDLRLLCLDAAFQDSRTVKLLHSRDDRALRRFRGINTRQSAGKHCAARGRGLARSLRYVPVQPDRGIPPQGRSLARPPLTRVRRAGRWRRDGGGGALRSANKRKGFRHHAIICDPSKSHNNKSERLQKRGNGPKWKEAFRSPSFYKAQDVKTTPQCAGE